MIKTKYAVLTNPGSRQKNEDSAKVQRSLNGFCVAVADGLGGHGGGDEASKAAVEKLLQCHARGNCQTKKEITEAVCMANNAVISCRTQECDSMSTLVALFIENERAVWAHVGDSRLYYFKEGRLSLRTLDHSVPQMAVYMGMIAEEQIRFHEDRNKILRALGGENFAPDISEPVSLKEGKHAFLLCTDGFWEHVLETEMEETLGTLDDPMQWILAMEKQIVQSAPEDLDNYTAAAVFVEGV